MRFLLATDTLIYFSKRAGNCLANLEKYLDSDIAISTINLFELEYGKARSNSLSKAGMPIDAYDLQHAGIALTNDLIFVTRNTDEFKRVPDLRLTNWY